LLIEIDGNKQFCSPTQDNVNNVHRQYMVSVWRMNALTGWQAD